MKREIAFSIVVGILLLYAANRQRVDEAASEFVENLLTPDAERIAEALQNPNVQAFLSMIEHAEGTARYGGDKYRVLYGGSLFQDFYDHPRTLVTAGSWTSTAAGAYQILAKTWDTWIQPKLQLPDFSPESQQIAAVFLLKAVGALKAVEEGRFDDAIAKAASQWASLPGAGYGQPEKKLSELRQVYASAGGVFA